jgi:ABC-2 type transport system ATP-binding protein
MSLALSIRQLSKTYANGLSALKGIDLDVEEGDFFALLGPNGAGKSTTIGIICSLVRKTGGSVSVFGTDIDRDFPRAKRHIGVVPQEFNFNNFEKVGDILATQAGYYGLPLALARERAEKYLHRLELWDKRESPARTLSGGMKRRLMIARALVHEPRLLILDEPTAGVDIELRRSMWAFLQELNAAGTTIILTTHYLEEAESLCRNIAIIDGGRIIENTGVKQLLRQMQVETFVLDLGADVTEGFGLDGYPTKVIDARTLEVTVQKGQSLNAVFAALSSAKLPVVSMRNKANRLEELFVGLLRQNKAEAAA